MRSRNKAAEAPVALDRPYGSYGLPPAAVGLQLHRIQGDELLSCEAVVFGRGVVAVDIMLRRAAISGPVGPVGETGDWWADILTDPDTWIDTVALSPEAWKALKNHWMRCTYVRS